MVTIAAVAAAAARLMDEDYVTSRAMPYVFDETLDTPPFKLATLSTDAASVGATVARMANIAVMEAYTTGGAEVDAVDGFAAAYAAARVSMARAPTVVFGPAEILPHLDREALARDGVKLVASEKVTIKTGEVAEVLDALLFKGRAIVVFAVEGAGSVRVRISDHVTSEDGARGSVSVRCVASAEPGTACTARVDVATQTSRAATITR